MAEQSIAPIHHPVVRRIIREILEAQQVYVLNIIEREVDLDHPENLDIPLKTKCLSYQNISLMKEDIPKKYFIEFKEILDKLGGYTLLGNHVLDDGQIGFRLICKDQDVYQWHQKDKLSWLYNEYAELKNVDPKLIELVVLEEDWFGEQELFFEGGLGNQFGKFKTGFFSIRRPSDIYYETYPSGFVHCHRIEFRMNRTEVVQRKLGVE